MMRPRLTVITVTFNSGGLLHDFVESLHAGLADVSWRLIVADNDSADDTVGILARLVPDAVVVQMGRNAGYAAGINAATALADATSPTLVLNPDVRIQPGCVPELLRALDGGAGIAVPQVLDGHGELKLSMRREPTLPRALGDALLGTDRAGRFAVLGEVVSDAARYETAATADWAEGSAQLVSVACRGACGRWDESFFLYSEETDFHLRARDAGFPLRYVPTAQVVHLGGESRTSAGLWSLVVANRVKLYARRHGPVATTCYWLVVLARETSRVLLGRRTSRRAVRCLLDPVRMSAARGPAWIA